MKHLSLLIVLSTAAQANLGGQRSFHTEPGLNRSTTDYVSCATELEQLGEVALVVGKSYQAPPSPPAPEPLEAQIEGRPLVLGLLPEVTVGRMPVVNVPPQTVILRWVDGFHKTTIVEAQFGGLYLLYPIAPEDEERVKFFKRWDVPVVEVTLVPRFPNGRYGLVPVSQISALEAVLREI